MSQYDTTSFSNSLLGGMQFGASIAERRDEREFRDQQAALSRALAERDFQANQDYRAAGVANMQADNSRQDARFKWDMAQAKQQAQDLIARKAADARISMALTTPPSQSMLVPDASETIDPEDLTRASPHIQDAWLKRSFNRQDDAAEREKAIQSVTAAKQAGVLRHALEVPGGMLKDVERWGLWGMVGAKDMPMSVAQQRDAESEQLRTAMIYDMAIQTTPTGQAQSNHDMIEKMSSMPLPMVQMYYKAHQEQQAAQLKIQQQQMADQQVVEALVRAKGMKPQAAQDMVTLDKRFPQSTGTAGQTQRTKLAAASIALDGAKRDVDRMGREYESIAKMLRGDKANGTPPTPDEMEAAAKGKLKQQQLVAAWNRYLTAQSKERDARAAAQSTAEVPESGSAQDATKTQVDNILDLLSP